MSKISGSGITRPTATLPFLYSPQVKVADSPTGTFSPFVGIRGRKSPVLSKRIGTCFLMYVQGRFKDRGQIMSRTAIKSFGLFIVGQIATIALMLCLTEQKVNAQTQRVIVPDDIYIVPGTGRNGLNTTFQYYMPNTALFQGYHLELGRWGAATAPYGTINANNQGTMAGGNNDNNNTNRLVFDMTLAGFSLETRNGGAIYLDTHGWDYGSSYFNFWNIRFVNNTSLGNGGAIYNYDTRLRLTNIFFERNIARGETGAGLLSERGGGAIYNDEGYITFRDVRFGEPYFSRYPIYSSFLNYDAYLASGILGNSTNRSGGALYNFNARAHAEFDADQSQGSLTATAIATSGNAMPRVNRNAVNSDTQNTGTPSTDHYNAFNNAPTIAFNYNWANEYGGAIYNNGGWLDFHSVANSNTATATATANGGGWAATAVANTRANAYPNRWRGVNEYGTGAGFFNPNYASRGTPSAPRTYRHNYYAPYYFHYLDYNAYAARYAALYGATTNPLGTLNWLSDPNVFNSWASSFTGNHAEWSGGAIYGTAGGRVTFVTRTENASAIARATAMPGGNATSYAFAHANSIAASGAVRFTNNSAREYGGAIYNNGNLNFTAISGLATAEATAETNADGRAYVSGIEREDFFDTTGEWAGIQTPSMFPSRIPGSVTFTGGLWVRGTYTTANPPVWVPDPDQTNPTIANDEYEVIRFIPATEVVNARNTVPIVANTTAIASVFDNNRARTGGALYVVERGVLEFYASSLGATATSTASGNNAWAFSDARSTAYGGIFTANVAEEYGGAIYNNKGTLSFIAEGATAFGTANGDSPANNRYVEGRAEVLVHAADFIQNKARWGGAIYNQEGMLTFEAGGDASSAAGRGISRVEIHGGTFLENTAELGGAIHNDGGILTFMTTDPLNVNGFSAFGNITNVIFERTQNGNAYGDIVAGMFMFNEANAVPGVLNSGRGGAIYNTNYATMEFVGVSRFIGNLATYEGGALYNENGSTLTFIATTSGTNTTTGYTTFTNNTADLGGAIFNDDTLNILNGGLDLSGRIPTGEVVHNRNLIGARFGGNSYYGTTTDLANVAGISGGAIYNADRGNMTLANVWMGYNRAGLSGGAIYSSGEGAIYGGLISWNKASVGGAIYNTNGNATNRDPENLDPKVLVISGTGFDITDNNVGYAEGIRFESNEAIEFGGAIFNTRYGVMEITDAAFIANRANLGGGAIYNAGVISVEGTVFRSNNQIIAGVATGQHGGAIYNTSTGVMAFIGNNLFINHQANESALTPGYGGSIYNEGGVLVFTENADGHTLFTQSRAYEGGAIYNNGVSGTGGSITMTGGEFRYNTAQRAGGALYSVRNGIVTLNSVDFDTNSAGMYGGAIYNLGTLNLTDVNFRNNSVDASGGAGGAIYTESARVTLTVTEGSSSVFDGNRLYTAGGTAGSYESIYFAGTGNIFSVDVKASARDAVADLLRNPNPLSDTGPQNAGLQMYDPMRGAANSETDITKTGLGTWVLSGNNDFQGEANFAVNAGTLYLERHLYDIGTPGYPNRVSTPASLRLGNGRFTLGGGANLIVDGAGRDPITGALMPNGSVISANGGIALQSNTQLTFHLSEADIARTRTGEATLTLESTGTIGVASTVPVYLAGAPLLGQNVTWREWFLGHGTDSGAREIYVINAGTYTSLMNNKVDGVYQWDSGLGDWAKWSDIQKRGTDGKVQDVLGIEEGYLKIVPDAEISLRTYWTGTDTPNNNVWNFTRQNWFAHDDRTGTGIVQDNLFRNGDYVIFANEYDYYDDGVFMGSLTPGSKTVNIGQNVSVGSMEVTGTEYTFNIATGFTLSADRNAIDSSPLFNPNIDFGSTNNINMGSGSRINADGNITFGSGNQIGFTGTNAKITADGNITFGSATSIGTSANGIKAGTQITAGRDILFSGDSNIFHFDMTGVTTTSTTPFLKLQGTNVSSTGTSGAVGGGDVHVNNFSGGASDIEVLLMQIAGGGTVTSTGRLLLDGAENVPKRSDNPLDKMLGLGTKANDKELWLLVVSAYGDVDNLHWTGRDSTIWDVNTSPNWSGTLNGVNVTTFLNGDTVYFDDRAGRKTVNLSQEVRVAAMSVTSAGYTFDLTGGGKIIADGRMDFGNGTTITSGLGSSLTAATIVFGSNTVFEFDLVGANSTTALLELHGNVDVSSGKIGSGTIDVWNISGLTAGSSVILVDAGTGNKTTNTGELLVDGNRSPGRSPAGGLIYGLATNADDSQLLLQAVNANAKSDDLVWTGKDVTSVRDGNRSHELYIWGEPGQGVRYANWKGTVEGINVDTFLNGDTVMFDSTASNRYVTINEGGVEVNSMSVTASGYTFDLTGGSRLGQISGRKGGGIVAAGRMDLRDSTIVVGLNYEDSMISFNRISASEITLDGAKMDIRPMWSASEDIVIAEAIRQNGGELDFDILISQDAPINDHGKDVGLSMAYSSYYNPSFFIDNAGASGRGVLRLSYFLFESLGWSHNTTEAGAALDILRHAWNEEDDADTFDWIGRNRHRAMNQLRGTELVADSLAMALWRPWEITHQRSRNVREESGWNSWGSGYYRFGNTSSDGNAEKYDMYRGGTMIGADYGSNKYWQFGGAFGYAVPTIESAHGKIDADDLTLGVYSKINVFEQAWVSSFLGYGYQNYKMTRHSINDSHNSKYTGDAMYASVELVRPITASILTIMPLVAIDHQTAWTKGFTESGRWGQTVEGAKAERTMLRLGVDTKLQGFETKYGRIDFGTRGQVAALLDGDRRATVVSNFRGSGASMSLHGVDMGWGHVNGGLSVVGEFRQKFQWFADVDGFMTGKTSALQGQAGFTTRW